MAHRWHVVYEAVEIDLQVWYEVRKAKGSVLNHGKLQNLEDRGELVSKGGG